MKITISFLTLLICLKATAQLDKRTWLVGGNSSFSAAREEFSGPYGTSRSNRLDWNLSATAGYFLTDRLATGLRTTLLFYKENIYTSGFRGYAAKFAAGPFGRYYLLKKDKDFNILTEASYQFGVYSLSPPHGGIRNLSLSAGPVIFFNSTAAVEILPGYYAYRERLEGSSLRKRRGFLLNIGFMLHLAK